MMRAIVKKEAKPGLWLEEVPVPEVGDDNVLIRIKKTSICGTDVGEYQHGPVLVPLHEPDPNSHHVGPLALGHEVVGIVEAIGEAVEPGRPFLGLDVVEDVDRVSDVHKREFIAQIFDKGSTVEGNQNEGQHMGGDKA